MSQKEVYQFLKDNIGKGKILKDKNNGIYEVVSFEYTIGRARIGEAKFIDTKYIVIRYSGKYGAHCYPCTKEEADKFAEKK